MPVRLVAQPPAAAPAAVPGGPVYVFAKTIWDWLTGRGPAPKPTVPTPTPTPTRPGTVNPEVVRLINVERARRGLGALADDPRLAAAARGWASVMAGAGLLSHGDFAARIRSAYPNVLAGEVIVEGVDTPADAVNAWMNSPPHRANLLDPRFTAAGAGLAASAPGVAYWCCDLRR